MPGRPIETMRSYHRMGVEAFVLQELTKRGHADAMPKDVAEIVAVGCRIDYGIWIVDCPSCPGAEMLDPDDLRFFCLGCYNEGHAGRWLRVVQPDDFEAITTSIRERPSMKRHWAGEPLDQVHLDTLLMKPRE